MQSIINNTKKIIYECSMKEEKDQKIIRNCINSMVETIIQESMKIVKRDPLNKSKNKKLIKEFVKKSLEKCNVNKNKIIMCINQEISSIIDISVDIMSELIS